MGFLRSASMILASEIGDKTFFIAAILAMNHSRLTVWSGSVFALALMTGLSAMMGAIAPNLLNKTTTHYVATGLFFLFGLRSVYDQTVGYDTNAESELEEVEKELKEHTSSSSSRTRGGGGRGGKTGPATRTRTKAKKQSPGNKINDILSVFFSPIFLQAFLMTSSPSGATGRKSPPSRSPPITTRSASRSEGFVATGCAHPRQFWVVKEWLVPSANEWLVCAGGFCSSRLACTRW